MDDHRTSFCFVPGQRQKIGQLLPANGGFIDYQAIPLLLEKGLELPAPPFPRPGFAPRAE